MRISKCSIRTGSMQNKIREDYKYRGRQDEAGWFNQIGVQHNRKRKVKLNTLKMLQKNLLS